MLVGTGQQVGEGTQGKNRALEVYRLLVDWPKGGWNERAAAGKALHDEFLAKGNIDEARELAKKVLLECAGKAELRASRFTKSAANSPWRTCSRKA